MADYNPLEIEKKWKKVWEEKKIYSPNLDTAKKPFYNLMMFPYPSAEGLHVGNMYAFTGADTYGRFKRMQGYDVFEPIGLDGFGIHSENYALKVGRHPKEQAEISEKNFYRQLSSIGNGFDWSRKLETYDPNYYKWTQWVFIQLFKKGLAYRKKAPVNFCPKDLTVLADEQVIDGKCERCGTVVEKRDLEQWFFKITDYAERLLNNIPKLNWTEKVKIAQREWIGKSTGAVLEFEIDGLDRQISVFTTRPDTLFGATFVVLSPEHPLVKDENFLKHVKNRKDLENYVQKSQTISDIDRKAEGREKTGVDTGLFAINPVNNEKVQVWVADYVLVGYGTGALFGDAHDERDTEFAKKYNIPLRPTIATGNKEQDRRIQELEECYTGYGTLIHSGQFTGLTSQEAMTAITEWLERKGKGKREVVFHLRDWLISRQRYWGPPIPMIYCETCGWQPVPEDQLPVLLPDVEDWKPKGNGVSPLANIESFVNTTCPNCKGPARRETDVSDTFLDSSWYFFRYLATEKKDEASDRARIEKWMPVAMYIGGAEHSVLHLLYSRFITMVFKDLGLVDFEEPYARFYAHGLIIKDGAKMSKSKGNIINPDEYLAKYGADVLRAYLRFVGPFDMGGDFRDSGIESMNRFLARVWKLVTSSAFEERDDIDINLKKLTAEVTEELENLRFNTAVARLMMYYNFLTEKKSITKAEIANFIKLLAPFAPFLAEELWQLLTQQTQIDADQKADQHGSFDSVHQAQWPMFDKEEIEKSFGATIVIQVNGKARGTIQGKKGMSQGEVEQQAKTQENVAKHLEGKTIQKAIYVQDKVVNFVVN